MIFRRVYQEDGGRELAFLPEKEKEQEYRYHYLMSLLSCRPFPLNLAYSIYELFVLLGSLPSPVPMIRLALKQTKNFVLAKVAEEEQEQGERERERERER